MSRIKGVDVNLDTFKDIKNIDELKKETGRIFGHLPTEEESAAYDELGAKLGLKAAAKKATQAQPITLEAPATPAQ
jgi:hypothetical protein